MVMENIFAVLTRIAPRPRTEPPPRIEQRDVRDMLRIRAEIEAEIEKQRLFILSHRRFML